MRRRGSRVARVRIASIAAVLALAGCGPPPGPTAAPPPAQPPAPAPGAPAGRVTPPAATAPSLDLGTAAPALGPPQAAAGGGVSWRPRASAGARELAATVARAGAGSHPDSVWLALARLDDRLVPMALRRLAAIRLAARDTLGADSALAALASRPTLWQWEALRTRADLMEARGERERAATMLEAASRDEWPELERAAWLARRARLCAALGDSARALELARQLIRRYPSLSPAASGVSLLEALLGARRERLNAADQEAAAEVEVFRNDRGKAAGRLKAALAAGPEDPMRVRARLAGILREGGGFESALKVLREGERAAGSDEQRARFRLEEARVERDRGRPEPAYAKYAEAARLGGPGLAETALWEAAIEADQAGTWSRAREFYRSAALLNGKRAGEARLRRALSWLNDASADSALADLDADSTIAARFWRAVASRARDRAGSDALLRAIAALPGFGFYETAARETLGIRGWPGFVASDSCPADESCEALAFARDLVVLSETPGFPDAPRAQSDAALVIGRWVSGDARVGAGGTSIREPRAMLAASRLAYALHRLPSAIRFARNAAEGSADRPAAEQWAIAPWIYPAGFDALFAALPESASGAPDRALVQAVTWQESKFDPAARSRSNALGLMQLKLPAARDVAGWLREPPPGEARLEDPAVNLRYGVAYLARLMKRFDGRTGMALAAYNAGAGRIPAVWRTWIERGGDALAAELLPFPETRDYVKRILSTRHAYRELAPSSAAP